MEESISPICLLPYRFEVKAIADFLDRCPYWNQDRQRTLDRESPHREVDDIYARFVPVKDWGTSQRMVWYYEDLTLKLVPLVTPLVDYVEGEELGGVLITRIPPRQAVHPHVDTGWHAEKFSKYLICIKANAAQAFCFEQQQLHTESGECFWFDNSHRHWVTNNTDEERVSLIVCIKTARGIHQP